MAKEAKQTLELIILIIFTWPVKIFSYIIIVSFATFGFHPAGVKQGSLLNLFNNSRVHQGLLNLTNVSIKECTQLLL